MRCMILGLKVNEVQAGHGTCPAHLAGRRGADSLPYLFSGVFIVANESVDLGSRFRVKAIG